MLAFYRFSETKCDRCGKLGTPRQQFEHMDVTLCFVCADKCVVELGSGKTLGVG